MYMRYIFIILFFYVTLIACNDTKTGDKRTRSEKPLKVPGNDEEMVRDVLNEFKDYAINEDYEGMVSLVSPLLLQKTSKKALLDELREDMHNENYDIIVKQIYYDDISKVIEKDGNKYALAKTRTAATFRMKKDLFDSFCEEFKMKYDKVTCEEDTKEVNLEMKGEAYVLYTNKAKIGLFFLTRIQLVSGN